MDKMDKLVPDQFQNEESEEFDAYARKHIEPTKRRARRTFDEDLAFLHDRLVNWVSCKGSNQDFADMDKEKRQTIMGIQKCIQWFRIELGHYLMDKVSKERSSYIPHDWRNKVQAVQDYIVEMHDKGEITLTPKDLKRHGLKVSQLTRALG